MPSTPKLGSMHLTIGSFLGINRYCVEQILEQFSIRGHYLVQTPYASSLRYCCRDNRCALNRYVLHQRWDHHWVVWGVAITFYHTAGDMQNRLHLTFSGLS